MAISLDCSKTLVYIDANILIDLEFICFVWFFFWWCNSQNSWQFFLFSFWQIIVWAFFMQQKSAERSYFFCILLNSKLTLDGEEFFYYKATVVCFQKKKSKHPNHDHNYWYCSDYGSKHQQTPAFPFFTHSRSIKVVSRFIQIIDFCLARVDEEDRWKHEH